MTFPLFPLPLASLSFVPVELHDFPFVSSASSFTLYCMYVYYIMCVYVCVHVYVDYLGDKTEYAQNVTITIHNLERSKDKRVLHLHVEPVVCVCVYVCVCVCMCVCVLCTYVVTNFVLPIFLPFLVFGVYIILICLYAFVLPRWLVWMDGRLRVAASYI